jgi:hypothetical protein
VFQVANNEIYEYGMVLFWSHFMTHFSQTGLIFNIETSKSFNGLARFGLGGLIFGLFFRSLSFGSRTRRDQNKTKKDPNKTVKTAIRPKEEDSFKTKRRPNCD